MFAGHLATGLAVKETERRLNLGWLFFAGLYLDFLFGILVLLGVEQVHVPANYAQTHYMTFTFPYSHSLTAAVIWSLLGFGLTYLLLRHWKNTERLWAGIAIGVTIFSHWILDWIVHIPELPLLGNGSPLFGLGLWNNLPVALALETALVVIGLILYYVLIKPKSNLARYGIGALVLFCAAMTILGMESASTPPPPTAAALSWIMEPVLIGGLAYWFDSKA